MKNTFVFLLAIGMLFSCKKSSSGGSSNTSSSLRSITVYIPGAHTIDVQTFTYTSTQLTEYRVASADTANPQILQETRVYAFQYSTSAVLPASSTFQVADTQGVNVQNSGGPMENFIYDNKNRLIEDSSLPDAGQSVYNYYDYIGDSVSFTIKETLGGSFPAGGLKIVNGNIAVSSGQSIVYGSAPNPLYDPAIGNTFGVYFIAGLIGYTQPNYAFPVDFISKNLPTSWNDPSGKPITTFTWTTGPDGKVTGGTASNWLPFTVGYNMTAQITFSYQ